MVGNHSFEWLPIFFSGIKGKRVGFDEWLRLEIWIAGKQSGEMHSSAGCC
jgi:hypothetical protein